MGNIQSGKKISFVILFKFSQDFPNGHRNQYESVKHIQVTIKRNLLQTLPSASTQRQTGRQNYLVTLKWVKVANSTENV